MVDKIQAMPLGIDKNDVLFLSIVDNTNANYPYRVIWSDNEGDSWNENSATDQIYSGFSFGPGGVMVASHRINSDTLELVMSYDRGKSWTNIDYNLVSQMPIPNNPSCQYDSDGYLYFTGYYNGNFRTINASVSMPTIIVDNTSGSIDFGTTYIDKGETHRKVKVHNWGDMNLDINVAIDGPDADKFKINTPNEVKGIAPNQTCEIDISFNADTITQVERNASLQIHHNDPKQNNPIQIPLFGVSVPVELSSFAVE